ncbi:hypothetical protein PBI_MAHDIA_29 [Gordonia phage Mahdia]|uniref:Uncharacterized protein n=1 Tax=Gordonia phage Mahdia TaxID=2047873 RepID=A0A2H4P9W9_9CAUD|nr:hypothetical protein FDJ14_gp29 [Gordonia phage Mahdia]ATW59028.1 hypothetical protein PBI_MAHDIA_29 [Gordonia phage Mahdia]
MTNPFLANNATPAAAPQAAPAAQAPAPATQAPAAQNTAPVAQGAAAIGGVPSVDSADPFASPTGAGDGSKISDDLDQAILLRPTEYIPSMSTSQGTTDAVRADWIVLTGPNQGQVRNSSLIFQKVLKSELRSIMGTPKPMMVAVLVKGQAKNGNSAPYLFAAADDATKALAAQAASAHNWI